MPRRVLDGKSGFQLRYNRIPSTRHFKVWGCLCFYRVEVTTGKLTIRWRRARFVGYGEFNPTYRILDLETNSLYETQQVVFRENLFPDSDGKIHDSEGMIIPDISKIDGCDVDVVTNARVLGSLDVEAFSNISPYVEEFPDAQLPAVARKSVAFNSDVEVRQYYNQNQFRKRKELLHSEGKRVSDSVLHPSKLKLSTTTSSTTGNSNDKESESTDIDDKVKTVISDNGNPNIPTPERCAYLRNVDIANSIWGDTLSESDRDFIARVVDLDFCLPTMVAMRDAIDSNEWEIKWVPAVQRECDNIQHAYEWVKIEDVPRHCRPLPTRFVLTIKSCGTYKCRCVVIGYLQNDDGENNFSPVAKLTSFRAAMVFTNELDLESDQLDVDCAFIRAKLPAEDHIYVIPPKGHPQARPGYIWKLTHALYGLRKSAKYWNSEMTTQLQSLGFERSRKDRCFFFHPILIIILILFVDDMVINGSRVSVDSIKEQIMKIFPCKDLGPLSVYLGIQIIRDRQNRILRMTQSEYTTRLLKKFGYDTNSKSVANPIEGKLTLNGAKIDFSETFDYRGLVGGANYLSTYTRPDISYTLSVLAKFTDPSKTTKEHIGAAKHFLKYLAGTVHACIVYNARYPRGSASVLFAVHAYVDTDWAGDPDTGRSTQCYFVLINDNLVDWKSNLQNFVALSSSEAEYVGLSDCATAVLFFRHLLGEEMCEILFKKMFDLTASIINEDNSGAIMIAEGGGSDRTKQISTKHHHIRDLVEEGIIDVTKILGTNNPPDLGTKPCKSRKNAMELFSKIKFFLEWNSNVETVVLKLYRRGLDSASVAIAFGVWILDHAESLKLEGF